MERKHFLVLALLVACGGANANLNSSSPSSDEASLKKSRVVVDNETGTATTVQVAFSAASGVQGWPFCTSTGSLTCSFSLPAKSNAQLPLGGKYLNATLAFGAPSVGCGSTKAELNINNPAWYDIVDISLVDGYSNNLQIDVMTPSHPVKVLGPNTAGDNSKVFGVFPLGCDVCVKRDQPSCGQSPGTSGCKSGTQYNPDVPCQFQGPIMGGGSAIRVILKG